VTTFTGSACGSTVEVAAGELFAVELAENPTTGYRWDFVPDPGVEVVSSSYTANPGSGVGGAGVRQFMFRANAAGEFVVRGKLWRSWLKDSSAIQRCEITVRVSAPGTTA
jgi:inhibitor of cysteine peptidase